MKPLSTLALMTLLGGYLAGCTQLQSVQYRNGPDIDFPQDVVKSTLEQQSAAVDQFVNHATKENGDPAATDNKGWHIVAHTGFNYVHAVCDDYIAFLSRAEKDKVFTDSGLAAVSTASTSILTAANASNALKYVAASFGLTTALNDATFSRYLFSQSAGAISGKIDELMHAYETTVDAQTLSSRADLFNVIRNDLKYCTPAEIEGTVISAISAAPVTVKTAGGTSVSTPGTSPTSDTTVAPKDAGLNAKATVAPTQ